MKINSSVLIIFSFILIIIASVDSNPIVNNDQESEASSNAEKFNNLIENYTKKLLAVDYMINNELKLTGEFSDELKEAHENALYRALTFVTNGMSFNSTEDERRLQEQLIDKIHEIFIKTKFERFEILHVLIRMNHEHQYYLHKIRSEMERQMDVNQGIQNYYFLIWKDQIEGMKEINQQQLEIKPKIIEIENELRKFQNELEKLEIELNTVKIYQEEAMIG